MNRLHRVLLATLLLVTASAGAAGATTLSLSWDSCTGPVARTIMPGGVAAVLISALGQAEPHKGYEFRVRVADGNGALPDAWRFDAGGCQGPERISIEAIVVNVISKVCPTFQGSNLSSQGKSFELASPDLGLPSTTGVIRLRNTYPNGNSSSLPTQRYHLGVVVFDHSFSVDGAATQFGRCGDFDRGMCLALMAERCYYVAMDDRIVPFTIGNEWVTANGGACRAVPARNATWGILKAQYRH